MGTSTVVLIVVVLIALLVVVSVVKAVQIIPQATAAVIERLGRFRGTADPGLVFLVPFVDKVRERIDLREQVVSFPPHSVITQDNLTVAIDTVVYYQVNDPKAAVYEISDYIVGVEQITTTTLRNVVGGMSLEDTLTSRDKINTELRHELDDATGHWGIRVRRVEIKAIDPPRSIQDSMERQMKADREKRAMILTAEGQRESAIRSAEGQKQSQILTAEGAKQAAILSAEAERQSRILRAQGVRAARYLEAQGEAKAIEKVFSAIKSGRPTPELLAYQYLQTLPQMAQGDANKVWIVPSDFGKALEGFSRMLGAPGEDGVFKFQPSPVEDPAALSRPEEDDESVKGWFDTAGDPAIAKVVAAAEAQARQEVPGLGAPLPPVPIPGPADPTPSVSVPSGAVTPAPASPAQLPSAPGPSAQIPSAQVPSAQVPTASVPAVAARPPAARPGNGNGHGSGPGTGDQPAGAGAPAGPDAEIAVPPHSVPVPRRKGRTRTDGDDARPARPGYPSPPTQP